MKQLHVCMNFQKNMLIFSERFAYFQNVIEWMFSKLVTS